MDNRRAGQITAFIAGRTLERVEATSYRRHEDREMRPHGNCFSEGRPSPRFATWRAAIRGWRTPSRKRAPLRTTPFYPGRIYFGMRS
jgi:hypothetical protein